MFTLPIDKQTFRRDFLDGGGRLELYLDEQLQLDQPFPNGIAGTANLSAGVNSVLEFGSRGDVSCRATFAESTRSGVEVMWPDKPSSYLDAHSLPPISPGMLGARLYLAATSVEGAPAKMPIGPLNFNFGMKAGAEVVYERFALYNSAAASRTVLTDLITGLRLPQHCGTVGRIPEPGELLVFQYNGFLQLNASLNWGYQLRGSQGIEFKELDAVVEYELRTKARVGFGYTLGGEFAIEARRGHSPDWVRLTVRKKRDSKFDSAASFDLTAKADPGDLPSSADEFLIAVLGADAERGLELFRKIRKCSDINKLEREAGKLFRGILRNLSRKWLGEALSRTSVAVFTAIVDRVLHEYENLVRPDRSRLACAIHLYQDYLGEAGIGVLEQALEKVAGIRAREDLANLSDSEAWAVINRLAGGDLFRLLDEEPIFADVVCTANRALEFLHGDFMPEIRDLVLEVKTSFVLSELFGALELFTSKDKLLKLADEKLKGVVEKLLGVAWEEIDVTNAAAAAARLKRTLERAEKFKNVWYERLVEGMNASFSLQLNCAYSRASCDQALIDVEIDLSCEHGRQLYETAARGDFNRLFVEKNLPLIVVHRGVLTHSVSSSAQLNINVFGWGSRHLVEVMAETENLIQTCPTGSIQVFATEAAIRQRCERRSRDKTTEIVQSNFLMRFSGDAPMPSPNQPFLIRSVNQIGAKYDLRVTDDRTTLEELRKYLDFAETLRLIPSAIDLSNELKTQFPGGLGKVRVRYVAEFQHDSIRHAFMVPAECIGKIAHNVTRDLVRAEIVAGHSITEDLTVVGLLYLDPAVRKRYEEEGFTSVRDSTWTVKTADGLQRTLKRELNQFIIALLEMEYKTIGRLTRLQSIVNRAAKTGSAVPEQELEDAAREFVESAADLNGATPGGKRINNFFAVFDAVIRAGSIAEDYCRSSMILEIQPEGGSKVTKYLSAGTPTRGL